MLPSLALLIVFLSNEKETTRPEKRCYRSVAAARFGRVGEELREALHGRSDAEIQLQSGGAAGLARVQGARGGKSAEHRDGSGGGRKCWCGDYQSIRDFRHFVLNGWDGPLPEGWVGEVIDLTAADAECLQK
jgi:hypothetical protein